MGNHKWSTNVGQQHESDIMWLSHHPRLVEQKNMKPPATCVFFNRTGSWLFPKGSGFVKWLNPSFRCDFIKMKKKWFNRSFALVTSYIPLLCTSYCHFAWFHSSFEILWQFIREKLYSNHYNWDLKSWVSIPSKRRAPVKCCFRCIIYYLVISKTSKHP